MLAQGPAIYTAENYWHGSDKNGSGTKKLALLPGPTLFTRPINVLVRVKGSMPWPACTIFLCTHAPSYGTKNMADETELKNDCACVTCDPVGRKISTQATNS